MNIIVCLDDNGGMLFNSRRQSRDGALCQRILEVTANDVLWMNEYSAKLFTDGEFKVDECFLEKAEEDDYCFLEQPLPCELKDKIGKVIVYRWNRKYPADVKFDASVLKSRRLTSSFEFKGTSHERITEEIFEL